jgi:DNA-directed RNA polymerase II subunit RPB2
MEKSAAYSAQTPSVMSHLDNYAEDAHHIIESYFSGQHLQRLARHQIESYNHFIEYQVHRTIQMFNPIITRSEKDYIQQYDKYFIETAMTIDNFRVLPPLIHENNGATKLMFPQEAKLRNFTYASIMTVDITITYTVCNTEAMDTPTVYTKLLTGINIGKMPVMTRSSICVLSQNANCDLIATGECPMDCGGYFVIKGSEKTVLGQERAAENRIYCYHGKASSKWGWTAEIKSVPDDKCISPKQVEMMIASKPSGAGFGILVSIPRLKRPVELFILFRALGLLSDKDICEHIVLDISNDTTQPVLEFLRASVIDASTIQTTEDAIQNIMSLVSYVPFTTDKDAGAKKKYDFTLDVLSNDLFPHCRTHTQKLFLLGYMARKLILASRGAIPADDRDSYTNKRIELTGTLLNNLFRNYFNKMIKEMQKHIVRELNSGSWRSNDDFANVVNMTNIYKILKSNTIENGINRALSTGDFSIKQTNSSKVGVAQVLNRLTYVASLSHLRRINTPLEKSGEMIAPRKLHSTTWGFLCPIETPEGQSVGVVKNISCLTHITIATSVAPIYAAVEPFVILLNSVPAPELVCKTKVFVNGTWLGITETPLELYNIIKAKKHSGELNIYLSVIMDYRMGEIRICSDGGRLVRPVLKVRNGTAIISQETIDRVKANEVQWNDLLTNCVLPESVIEYIDPDEQSNALIYVNSSSSNSLAQMRYTHCEIHPSTMFGVLASCIPFPEHNQSPRNCYQTAMCKQALGVYALNYDQRMDKTAYVLTYPSRPLVDTRIMNFLNLNRVPSGEQIHVAIMSYTGYNQEDSVLLNQGSVDRGMFLATIYHTEKDEDKNIVRDEIIRCKPDITKTRGVKFGNYDKLDANGFIPEDSLVANRDIIIAKTMPIKESRNDPSKSVKFEDQSKVFRTTEPAYIDKNYTGRNGDGYNFAKVRVRILRKPNIGDKFACALPTQQVLTHLGWVEFKDIDIAVHRVCTLDGDGNMCYEHPVAKFEYDYDGPMYSVENKQAHIVCTPNHKLYVRRRASAAAGAGPPQFEQVEAQHVMGKKVQFQKSLNNAYPDVPTIRLGEGDTEKEYNMNAWLKLLGMFISDGSVNNRGVILSALKQRKVDYNTALLTDLGVAFYHDPANGYFAINKAAHREIYNELLQYSVGAANKFLPEYVWDLSQAQCIILLEALVSGDGNVMTSPLGKTDFSRYYTISKRLADDITRLATHCGWSGIVKIKDDPDTAVPHLATTRLGYRAGESRMITCHNIYYMISIIKKQNQPWINTKVNDSNTERLVPYNGKVYCVEMPSSNLYYFRENNFAASMLSGNSRAAQKATCGLIVPECDMPFTREGLRPDIILNPHAIPSRMTIAQLKETLLGKVLVELGMFGDGTAFGELSVQTIIAELQKLGYERHGEEIMYDGASGQQLSASIFIGPVFYQRLKHMVSDKQHSRSIGPMVNLTRQPAEGRSRDGGFRIGGMERDVMIAHGMSQFCRERLYTSSDKYSMYVCKKCGMTAAYNDGSRRSDMSVHVCRMCDNTAAFARVEIPYAYKLLTQELQTINIVPRIITA